ncbi:MAG: DUF4157 domain-containing protein [Phaeodactylibacter sp.]|nr:DUF4157 domain-containing protein [Phaeodactylibacter sp.]
MKSVEKKNTGNVQKKPVAGFFNPNTIYPKLTIGQPDDQYEREADAMGERALSMKETNGHPTPTIQSKCTDCPDEERLQQEAAPEEELPVEEAPAISRQVAGIGEEEEETSTGSPLMRKSANSEMAASPNLSSRLQSMQGQGQPLAAEKQAFFGRAFGRDFSGVRVHTDEEAVRMNEGLHARAFTHGSDIYFNRGQYDPGFPEGKRLLGHELAHVVQQGRGLKTKPLIQRDARVISRVEGTGRPTDLLIVIRGQYWSFGVPSIESPSEYPDNFLEQVYRELYNVLNTVQVAPSIVRRMNHQPGFLSDLERIYYRHVNVSRFHICVIWGPDHEASGLALRVPPATCSAMPTLGGGVGSAPSPEHRIQGILDHWNLSRREELTTAFRAIPDSDSETLLRRLGGVHPRRGDRLSISFHRLDSAIRSQMLDILRSPSPTEEQEQEVNVEAFEHPEDVNFCYEEETNRVGIFGSGAEDYLREHFVAGDFDSERFDLEVEEEDYFVVEESRLDEIAQEQIARDLSIIVDRRVLLTRRPSIPRDTEIISGSELLAPNGWNGEVILENFTQYDTSSISRADQYRCSINSFLAAHIIDGSEAIANVASETLGYMLRIIQDETLDEDIRDRVRDQLRGVRILAERDMRLANFSHLSTLADALYIVLHQNRIQDLFNQGEDQSLGTLSRELQGLEPLGHSRVSSVSTFIGDLFSIESRFRGRLAVSGLPRPGEYFGMESFRRIVQQLSDYQSVALVIGVPYESVELEGIRYVREGRITHDIALVVNESGQVFVYDPYPRQGSQLLRVNLDDLIEFEPYFLGRWIISARVAAASSSAEGPWVPLRRIPRD